MRKGIVPGVLLAFLLLSGFIAAPINTACANSDGQYTYSVSNGGATVTGYSGSLGAITVPATLGSYPVVGIGDLAFASKSGLTSVSMPDSVTSIGYGAFAYCDQLTTVVLSQGLVSIGDNAFFPAPMLSSLSLPDGLVSIGQYAFSGTGLESIDIPGSLSSLGYCALTGLRALVSIEVDPGNAHYASVDGVLYDKEVSTLITCPSARQGSLTIPASVTNIDEYSFTSASLSSVIIPDTVISIGQNAFCACERLASVNIPDGLTTISTSAFSYCYALTSITIPDSVSRIQYAAFFFCINLGSVTIGASVTTIDGSAFAQCSSLRTMAFLGLTAPTSVAPDWIDGTPLTLRGIASNASNFPPAGQSWNGLMMGANTPVQLSAPRNLTVSYADGQVRLSWISPGDGVNVTNYQIYRSKNTTEGFIPIASPSSLFYNDSGLEGGWTYWYEVGAVHDDIEGPRAITSVFVPVDPDHSQLPSAPQALEANSSDTTIALRWQPPASAGSSPVSDYLVYRNGQLVYSGAELEYIDTSVALGFSYTYDVSARNSYGEGPKETIVAALKQEISLPSAPLGLTATAGDRSVVLSWREPLSDGGAAISNYMIYENGYDLASTSDGTILTYTVTGLRNGDSYTFHVAAVNAAGEGPGSSSIEATPTGGTVGGLSWHNGSKGYSLLVPDGWSVQEDQMIGGNHTDTFIVGPTVDGFRTNIVVLRGSDPSMASSQEYLNSQVVSIIEGLRSSLGSEVVITDQRYLTISNHTAVIFGYDLGGYNVHQVMAIILDASQDRYWIITCSESATARAQIDPQFDAVINSFTITSSTTVGGSNIWPVLAIVVVISIVVIAIVFFVIRARRPGNALPGQENASSAPSAASPPSFCMSCGSRLSAEWSFCPRCQAPVTRDAANPAPHNGDPVEEEKKGPA
jgi:hypothetical protein